LSKARLARLHDVMAGYVERGEVPGLVALVSRRGDRHVETLGIKALGESDPVQRDAIFRIASMTKPITAVAAMILVEECKLRLDDPVDRLLPELADRRVLKRLDGPLDDTEPARRPITFGSFGWDGGLGTSWRSDPSEDMVAILLTQASWTSPVPPRVTRDFWTSAYQAIDD
jgi:CubicO group peptidase (beta-lactamase class C family)